MNHYRQDLIREFIEKQQLVTIKDLQKLVPDVSLMTIHRDLDVLEQAGAIVKVRGGARSVHHSSDLDFDIRLRENNAAKLSIAQKAIPLIQQGSSVFLDASTTNLVLSRMLPDVHLTVFTTSPNIAIELCHHSHINVFLCGGTINRKNMALSGQNTVDMLSGINIDLAFMGVSGCSAEAGFTCGTENDMVIKRMVIQKARTSVVMCDHSKFSRLMPYTFARFEDVNYLICEKAAPDAVVKAAVDAGTRLL